MTTKYSYVKTPVDIGRLNEEILAETGITKTLLYCNFNGPNKLDIFFDSDLSGAEQTLLDDIVTNHSGEPIPEPAILPTGDLPANMITASDGGGTAVWVDASNIIYNILNINEYETSSEDIHSTTSTNWQQKLRLVLTDLAVGKYKIDWYYEWAYSHGNSKFKARIELDDTDTCMETAVRPSESSVSDYRDGSGFAYVNLTGGSHHIDLDYCSSKRGKTSYIRRARIALRRV
jgi:hypothetical protein